MNKVALKKALVKGILPDPGLALVRPLLNGGALFARLFTARGILTLIRVPIAFAADECGKEKKQSSCARACLRIIVREGKTRRNTKHP